MDARWRKHVLFTPASFSVPFSFSQFPYFINVCVSAWEWATKSFLKPLLPLVDNMLLLPLFVCATVKLSKRNIDAAEGDVMITMILEGERLWEITLYTVVYVQTSILIGCSFRVITCLVQKRECRINTTLSSVEIIILEVCFLVSNQNRELYMMYVTICFDIEILNAKTDGMYVEIPPITKLREWHALNPKLQRLHDVESLITSLQVEPCTFGLLPQNFRMEILPFTIAHILSVPTTTNVHIIFIIELCNIHHYV